MITKVIYSQIKYRKMFRRIEQKIENLKQNKTSEESFNQTIQSYLGTPKHCNSHKLRRMIKEKIYDV